MELTLNVYEDGEIKKTYTAEAYNIMFGTVEDLINAIDFEKFQSGKDDDLIKGVASAIPKIFGIIKPLLKDIFIGITDKEIKQCRLLDIASVIVKVIKFTMSQVMEGAKGKN